MLGRPAQTTRGASCWPALSVDRGAKPLAKHPHPEQRDPDRPGAGHPAHPAAREALRADRRTDRTAEMRPPLAPVEARPAQHACPLGPPRRERTDIDTDAREKLNAGFGDDAGLAAELGMALRHQRIGDGDTQSAGEMVVAGARVA
jgi:hypothetical protein